MLHNGSATKKNAAEMIKVPLETVQTRLDSLNDQWALALETDPTKIRINEKTVYAVDQAMNVVLTDLNGIILYSNDGIYDLTLYKPEELLGGHTSIFNAGYHPKSFFKEMWQTIKSGKIWRGDIQNKRKDGKIIWVRLIITPLLDESGQPFQFLALKEDITEKKEMEFHLAQKHKQLSALTSHSYDIVGILNIEGEIAYHNPAFSRVLGFTSDETIGANILDFLVKEDQWLGKEMLQVLLKQPHVPMREQMRFVHKNGGIRWCDIAFTNYLDDPHLHGIVFNLRDNTLQKEAADKVKHLANDDHLTGLPNRRHFEQQLSVALEKAKAAHARLALFFLDLDGFKNVNDTLGHDIGDRLLKSVAERLSSTFSDRSFVARLGGDEFSMIVENIESHEELVEIAETMIQSFSTPFPVGVYKLNISTSIGISVFPQGGKDQKTMLKHADIAMYQAKNHGKNHYRFYDSSMDTNNYKLFLVKNDLHKALEKNQFFMFYQPRLQPENRKMVGAEALIRWSHPELGSLSHVDFLHFAEESGFIIPLGEWIIRDVCTQVKEWQTQGLPAIKVSVNLSVAQLMHHQFLKSVKMILDETELDAKWLEFEIPESVLFRKEESVLKTLQGIKKLGITLALDNFGTGYSFLNNLSTYGFDVIKMDRSIIDDIETSQESYEVVMSIVKLAQKLNKHVVAHGIETNGQLELVNQIGFDESQGFLFSKPVESHRFESLLREEAEERLH